MEFLPSHFPCLAVIAGEEFNMQKVQAKVFPAKGTKYFPRNEVLMLAGEEGKGSEREFS